MMSLHTDSALSGFKQRLNPGGTISMVKIHSTACVDPVAHLDDWVTVGPGAHVTGDCLLRPYANIGPDAQVVNAEIGFETHIGAQAMVCGGRVGDFVEIGEHVELFHAIVGDRSVVGARTVLIQYETPDCADIKADQIIRPEPKPFLLRRLVSGFGRIRI